MPDVPASKGYRDGFATRHMIKDLCLAIAAAEHVSSPLPVGREAKTLYEQVGEILYNALLLATGFAAGSQLKSAAVQVAEEDDSLDFAAIYQRVYDKEC